MQERLPVPPIPGHKKARRKGAGGLNLTIVRRSENILDNFTYP